MAPIHERTAQVDGVRTVYRQVDGDGPPAVFVHGHPTHSEDWLPFLERLGRPAIAPDLPGWGFSDRPDADAFDYSMHGLSAFVQRFLEVVGVREHSLVVHDWGGLALIGAQQRPERVRRLVVINAVPLLPGYRWHWLARYFWRVPIAGELFNLATTKTAFRLLSRQSNARPGPLPPQFVDLVWRGWRRGLAKPVLELYRSGDPDALAAAGAKLGELDCPALVVWGAGDPYLPEEFGRAYAERLPNSELLELENAGHWPWLDRPELIETVVDFLQESRLPSGR